SDEGGTAEECEHGGVQGHCLIRFMAGAGTRRQRDYRPDYPCRVSGRIYGAGKIARAVAADEEATTARGGETLGRGAVSATGRRCLAVAAWRQAARASSGPGSCRRGGALPVRHACTSCPADGVAGRAA